MTKHKIIGFAIGPIGSAILGFISLPLITWFFSIEDIGRISMLQVTVSFMILLFCLGLDQAYVREYHGSTNRVALLKACTMPGLVLMLLSLTSAYLISPTLISEWLYDLPSSTLTIATITCFILTFLSRFLALVVRMEERAVAYSMSQLLPKILFLAFIISIVWLGFSKDFYSLIFAHTLSIIATFTIFLWNTKNSWVQSITCQVTRSQQSSLLSFGLPLVIGGLASWGLNVMDRLFLRQLSSFEELGVYSVTMSIAGAATIFAGIFNTIWAPMVFRWINEDDNVDLDIIDKIAEHLLAVIYFITVLAGIFSWILPYFLPDQYSAIQYLIIPCLLAPLFYTLSETTAVGIAISRKTKLSMIASIVAMLVNAVGNYLLIPKIGAAGAAISTAFAFWAFYILRTEFSRRVWRNIPSKKTYFIITLLLINTIINTLVIQEHILGIILWLCLGVAGYFWFSSSISLLINKVYSLYGK